MDENKIENPGTEPGVDVQKYLDHIKTLQDNTVSKEVYQKLQEENRSLLQTISQGRVDSSENSQPKTSISDLKKRLTSGELNNLDYIKTSLELRDRVLEETGIDQYAGNSHTGTSEEALASAQRVADSLREMVKKSEGKSQVFTGYYQAEVKDNPIRRK